jgi:hypothetical protein
MVRSLQDVVDDIMNKTALLAEDIVVDIGCNDGTMLNMFPAGVYKVGFDPALNLHKPDCNMFVNDYFTADAYNFVFKKRAKVITAIAMFYDLPSPVDFVKDVASILDEDGLFVIQFTDLRSMFEACAFDNICNEHLEYYGLEDVVNILNRADLRVIDVSHNDVNGGSIRVTATHRDSSRKSADIVVDTLVEEWKYFKYHDFGYFADRIKDTKTQMEVFLKLMKEKNNTLHLLGASTKGNTLLQYCNITKEDIPYAAEVNPDKFGLRTAGSDIEIISEEASLEMHPDMYIVPVWHFKKSILNNPKIQTYLNSGGYLVFPLPEFTVIGKDGELKYG